MLSVRRPARHSGGLLAALVLTGTLACKSTLPEEPRLATIAQASGNSQTGAVGTTLAEPLMVRVADQNGVPIEGALITWRVTSGGGVVTPALDTTDAAGLASTNFRLGAQLGAQTASATLSGAPPVSFLATATAGPPSKLAIAGGDGQSARVGSALPIPLQVKVTDGFNNPVAGVDVHFTVIVGGGSLSAATATSDAQGVARVNWTLGPTAGTQTVVAGYLTLTPVTFSATALP